MEKGQKCALRFELKRFINDFDYYSDIYSNAIFQRAIISDNSLYTMAYIEVESPRRVFQERRIPRHPAGRRRES